MITYLRTGRLIRGTGKVIWKSPDGIVKVKPERLDWGCVLITPAEIEAGREKPPIQPREKPVTPSERTKRVRIPKTPPVPRWRQLVEEIRIAQTYGDQFVSIQLAGEIANELEAAQNLFQSKP